jgi:hypothetical protein
MSMESTGMSERLGAMFTSVRSFPCVNSAMLEKVAFTREGFGTQRTRERFLSRVNPLMTLQQVRSHKGFSTKLTSVNFVPGIIVRLAHHLAGFSQGLVGKVFGVRPVVTIQCAYARECLGTQRTTIRSLPGVNSHMIL